MHTTIQVQNFETDLLNFEQNRMYPPGYGKEPLMKKLTLDHSEAVSAAKLNMIRIADQATTPKFRAEIERRVNLLGEVYWWVLQTIYNPGLPLSEIPDAAGNHPEEKPDDHGSANG